MASTLNEVEAQIASSIQTKQRLLSDRATLEKIYTVSEMCCAAFKRGNRVLLAGNGGSAADAQHIAAEFVSRFMFDRPGLPSIALTTDTSMLTAIGNDYGYEKLFERQLEANGREGDIFIGITTSGNSANVLRAIERCKTLRITSIGLCGTGGRIHQLADHVIAAPSTETPRIQECHILIGHIICGIVENALFERPST